MENYRMRRGNLETATHFYYNPLTGRTMEIIGVCHAASESFWYTINRRIRRVQQTTPGVQVHFESVRDTEGRFTDRDAQAQEKFWQQIGLQYQRQGLRIEDHWIRTDMTLPEVLAKFAKPQTFLDSIKSATSAFETMSDSIQERPEIAPVVRRVLPYLMVLSGFINATKNRREWSRVILDERNRYAVSAMVSTGTDIITVWGAAHLKGMKKILTSCGYDHVRTSWNVCIPRTKTI